MADSGVLADDYDLYIGGRRVEPEAGRYDDVSPATEGMIATAPDASPRQVDHAVAAARRAFDSGDWACAAPQERARCLNQRIRTGQVAVNGCGPGDAPFGGFKQSGFGREGGLDGLRRYTEPKAIGVPR